MTLLRAVWRRRPVRMVAVLALAGVAAALAAGVAVNHRLVDDAAPYTRDAPGEVPARPVALVFGVLVEPDGTPSPRLVDRLTAAVELYRAGRVGRLLMTGDSARPGYDEVGAMRSWAVARGVPAEAVSVDGGGLDTYDSCLRAHRSLGVDGAVLVTQAYHLPRALYLCRGLGIDAVGLAVPDWAHAPDRAVTRYPRTEQARHTVREWLARVNAAIDLRRGRPPALPD